MRLRGLALVGLLACAQTPVEEPRSSNSVAPASAAERRVAEGGIEPPCARAERWVKRARSLAQEGWVHRPLRLLRHARNACESAGDDEMRARLERVSQADSARATIVHRPEGGRIVGVRHDGSVVVIANESSRRSRESTLTLLDGSTGLATHVIDVKHSVEQADTLGDRLITVAQSEVHVWSLERAERTRVLRWTDERYRWAALMDGGRLVAALADSYGRGVLRVFDAASGDSVGEIAIDGGREPPAARLDDRHVVVGRGDEVLIVDVKSIAVKKTLESKLAGKPGSALEALATSPSGRVAAATSDGKLLVWKLDTVQPLARFESGQRRMEMALSKDGSRLFAAAGFFRELRSYDVASGRAVASHRVEGDALAFVPHAERMVVTSRSGWVHMQDMGGAELWPVPPRHHPIEAIELSQGLALSFETREGNDSFVNVWAWYRGHVRRFASEGYRDDVLAVSPSGEQVAAVVSSSGRLWSVASGNEQVFRIPDARGFPDRLSFAGEAQLRLVFERQATSWVAKAPFSDWQGELTSGALSGFGGTAVSIHGDVVTRDDGKLTHAKTGATLVPKDVGGFAFSADGKLLFAGAPNALAWFDAATGEHLGQKPLACTPGAMSADRAGALVAFTCGYGVLMTLRPPATARKLGGEQESLESLRVSPDGRLIAVHRESRIDFMSAAGELVGTLSLRGGDPMFVAPDGRFMFWGAKPGWQDTASCRIGRRAAKLEACMDRLMDDAMLELLLVPA